jgi:hypothetical protein
MPLTLKVGCSAHSGIRRASSHEPPGPLAHPYMDGAVPGVVGGDLERNLSIGHVCGVLASHVLV